MLSKTLTLNNAKNKAVQRLMRLHKIISMYSKNTNGIILEKKNCFLLDEGTFMSVF